MQEAGNPDVPYSFGREPQLLSYGGGPEAAAFLMSADVGVLDLGCRPHRGDSAQVQLCDKLRRTEIFENRGQGAGCDGENS